MKIDSSLLVPPEPEKERETSCVQPTLPDWGRDFFTLSNCPAADIALLFNAYENVIPSAFPAAYFATSSEDIASSYSFTTYATMSSEASENIAPCPALPCPDVSGSSDKHWSAFLSHGWCCCVIFLRLFSFVLLRSLVLCTVSVVPVPDFVIC